MSSEYTQNAKWLKWLSPFRVTSISIAYVTPFLLGHGISLADLFWLQTIYSLALVLGEIPGGIIADRLGRAATIKISGPIAAITMIAYGLSTTFWQFTICELCLALAGVLINGVDDALLIDSIRTVEQDVQQRDRLYVRSSRQIRVYGLWSFVIGAPIAWVLVNNVSLSSTLVADGIATAVGVVLFSFRLTEAKRTNGGQKQARLSAIHAVIEMFQDVEVRWLVALSTCLSSATYMALWISAPYYQSIGVPVVMFGVIQALRNGGMALIAGENPLRTRFLRIAGEHLPKIRPLHQFTTYALLAGTVYFGMATKQLWLIWVLVGHDLVRVLSTQPLVARINRDLPGEHLATLNSALSVVQRLAFAAVGPAIGLLVDSAGLSIGLLATGAVFGAASLYCVLRLRKLATFE